MYTEYVEMIKEKYNSIITDDGSVSEKQKENAIKNILCKAIYSPYTFDLKDLIKILDLSKNVHEILIFCKATIIKKAFEKNQIKQMWNTEYILEILKECKKIKILKKIHNQLCVYFRTHFKKIIRLVVDEFGNLDTAKEKILQIAEVVELEMSEDEFEQLILDDTFKKAKSIRSTIKSNTVI